MSAMTTTSAATTSAARSATAAAVAKDVSTPAASPIPTINKILTEAAIDRAFAQAGKQAAAAETVRVRLPLLENREDDRIEIGYNGRMYVLKRGETVDLPMPLFEILEHARLL